jgi:hypothetical protein
MKRLTLEPTLLFALMVLGASALGAQQSDSLLKAQLTDGRYPPNDGRAILAVLTKAPCGVTPSTRCGTSDASASTRVLTLDGGSQGLANTSPIDFRNLRLLTANSAAQTRWYLSALGTDTLSLERFDRTGNTISGLWVTYHAGADRHREILRHEYTITLRPDGRPLNVHLTLRRPDSTARRVFDARFGDDSVTIAANRDTLSPHRIAARHPYPLLGASVAMIETLVAGTGVERGFSETVRVVPLFPPDTATVTVVPITGPFIARELPVVLKSWSAQVGGPETGIFVTAHGVIDSLVLRDGTVPLRRVDAFDIDAIALAAVTSHQTDSSFAALRTAARQRSIHAADDCDWRALSKVSGQIQRQIRRQMAAAKLYARPVLHHAFDAVMHGSRLSFSQATFGVDSSEIQRLTAEAG